MKQLDVVTFGKRLIELDDLHPEYSLLWKAMTRNKHSWSTHRVLRWTLAYCLFSHCGAASLLCGCKEWDKFYATAKTIKVRGKTRRYFRGQWLEQGISYLREHYDTPEDSLRSFIMSSTWNFDKLMNRIQEWPQWGVWASFKLGDILERLHFIKASIPYDVQMDKKPLEGVSQALNQFEHLWSENQDDPGPTNAEGIEELCNQLNRYNAPPRYERPIGVLECETILCKWVSHLKGKYKPGKELYETEEELRGHGKYADDLRRYVKLPNV